MYRNNCLKKSILKQMYLISYSVFMVQKNYTCEQTKQLTKLQLFESFSIKKRFI